MKIFIFDYIGVRIFVRISPIITIGEIIFFYFFAYYQGYTDMNA